MKNYGRKSRLWHASSTGPITSVGETTLVIIKSTQNFGFIMRSGGESNE